MKDCERKEGKEATFADFLLLLEDRSFFYWELLNECEEQSEKSLNRMR